VASVEITKGGTVLATRGRSASAPVVKVLSPKKGDRVGAGKLVEVRWTATDSDNDPLTLKVAYAVDGKNFLSTFVGPNNQTQFLPSDLFAGSRKARIRVTANDGFNETSAISAPFSAVGHPPTVQILDPAAGLSIRNDASLQLRGIAFDDLAKRITAKRRLTWSTRGKVIGRGSSVSVSGLAPGNRTITLAARDRAGHTGRASVRVKVRAAAPRFLVLAAPAKVAQTARSFKLKVASSLPGTLRIGKQQFAVGRASKTLKVKVKPGSTPLALTLRLKAYTRSIGQQLTIAR
jgi:hypothetical protein